MADPNPGSGCAPSRPGNPAAGHSVATAVANVARLPPADQVASRPADRPAPRRSRSGDATTGVLGVLRRARRGVDATGRRARHVDRDPATVTPAPAGGADSASAPQQPAGVRRRRSRRRSEIRSAPPTVAAGCAAGVVPRGKWSTPRSAVEHRSPGPRAPPRPPGRSRSAVQPQPAHLVLGLAASLHGARPRSSSPLSPAVPRQRDPVRCLLDQPNTRAAAQPDSTAPSPPQHGRTDPRS